VTTAAADDSGDIDSHGFTGTGWTYLLFLPLSPRPWRRPRTRAGGSQSPA
jgi:hypothetical protein